jgi:hypothetical protein
MHSSERTIEVVRDTPDSAGSQPLKNATLHAIAGFALAAISAMALIVAVYFVAIAVIESRASDLWFLSGYLLFLGATVGLDLAAEIRVRKNSAVPVQPAVALNSRTSWLVRITCLPFALLAALMMSRTGFTSPIVAIGIALLSWSSFDVAKFVSASARYRAYLLRSGTGRG